jgi:hypothetical protein
MEAVGDVKLAIFFLSAFIPVALVILLAVWANEGVEGGKEGVSNKRKPFRNELIWYIDNDWLNDPIHNRLSFSFWPTNKFYIADFTD